MILFGVNFSLYFLILIKEYKSVWKNEELRAYFGIIAAATAVITFNILPQYGSVTKAFRYAVFQVGTIITTTGYATTDFNLWPMLSKCILIALMIFNRRRYQGIPFSHCYEEYQAGSQADGASQICESYLCKWEKDEQ